MDKETESYGGRLAGALLAAASALSVIVMAHHPTNSGATSLANLVHGALMVLLLIVLAGFSRFVARLGLDRIPVLMGLIFYGAAAVGNLMAATINGFAVPALTAANDTSSRDIFALAWALNQALAYAAVYATSAAFVLWGADMLTRRRPRVGAIALAAGAAPAALLAYGALDMHVAGAFAIYAMQAAFGVIIGVLMIRGRA